MKFEEQISDLKQRIQDSLQLAQRLGASSAEASISKVQGISVGSRMREIETLEYTNDGALGITVYCGQRKGAASTADLSPQALSDTVKKAVQIAKYTSDDPCSGLADKEDIEFSAPDLKLCYPREVDPQEAIDLVLQAENAALDSDSRIVNSDGASYAANQGVKVYGNTHGLVAGFPSSRYSMSCMVIGQDNADMQRDYAYTVSRDHTKLASAQSIGLEAAELTLARLNPRKVPTGKYPVLFDKTIAGGLFGHLVGAISGGSLYRQSSFLLDHLGKQVLPDWCHIDELPHLVGELASSPFDGEGVKTKDMRIVEAGTLQHYLLTSYSARKLGMQTNGHAGGIHNWHISHSDMCFQQLLKKMQRGLVVTELMGQGVNLVNGDYSRGAAGFWVENGEIQYPVAEVTIAGNLRDMLLNMVAVGSDVDSRGAIHTGSVLLEQMAIAGE